MTRYIQLVLACLLLTVAPLWAQVALFTGQPFTLTWTHDGVVTDEYRVYTDNTLTATVPVSALVNGSASYRFANGLPNGNHTLAVSAFKVGLPESERGTVNATVTTSTSGPNTPGSVTIVPDPQVWYVQVEDFDNGGEGIAYHDATVGNSGGVYRNTDVDIQATTDANGGYNVGWTRPGEWLRYTVNVATAGNYALSFRVASPIAGGTFHLEVEGVNVTGTLTMPNSGGWQVWTTVNKSVVLNQGQQQWRLVLDSYAPGSTTLGNFNWIGAVFKTP